jgi:hypothetical protein
MVDPNLTIKRKKRRVRKHVTRGILSKHHIKIGRVKLFHIIVSLILAFIVGVMVLRYVEKESRPASVEQQ